MNKILLLLEHKENRRRLHNYLTEKYQVILADTSQALDASFDLGILDGMALHQSWEQVQARKETEQPLFLPFLLVTSRQDVGLITRHLWKTVDELILTPIELPELHARVEILLRARKSSIALKQSNDELINANRKVSQNNIELEDLNTKLQASLDEKEVLLREVHHRVKNNLQVLIYLIDMQSETIKAPEVIHALGDLQGRTRAMSLVHEKLYQSENLAQIDFGEYLTDLTSNLSHALVGDRGILLRVDAKNIFLNVNIAIPCGMIVNELVTNAFKYAFPEDKGMEEECEIRIKFSFQDDEYVLTVSDNGVGLPPELDWRTTDSLGLKLVNIWASYQLGGSIEVNTSNGTAFTIRFTPRKQGGVSNG